MTFTEEDKKKIGTEIDKRVVAKKGSDARCPMCTNPNFVIVDGYTQKSLSQDMTKVALGGQIVPSITAVCTNCGFITEFSLGVLGFIKKDEGKNNGENKK